jgi:hypothetical protein
LVQEMARPAEGDIGHAFSTPASIGNVCVTMGRAGVPCS